MSLAVQKITAPKRLSSLVKYELHPDFCRSQFTLLAGDGAARPIVLGQLLAMTYAAAAMSAIQVAGAGNTGDGVLALDNPAFTSAAVSGDYIIVCTTGGADGVSKFRVEKPDGTQVNTATGGAAFVGHIKFTISGGAADFVEGDKFTVSVAIEIGAASNKVAAWVPSAVDGTERIWGIAISPITAADAVDATGGLAIRRDAILVGTEIAWPDGITDDQKSRAIVTLEELRLIVR